MQAANYFWDYVSLTNLVEFSYKEGSHGELSLHDGLQVDFFYEFKYGSLKDHIHCAYKAHTLYVYFYLYFIGLVFI